MSDVIRHPPRRPFPMSVALISGLFMWCSPALALNPALDVSQYAHTAWKIRDGFIPSRITAMAQTQDGYLWLGTESGLFRFDGVKVVAWRAPGGTSLPSAYVRSLLAARDGTLWIGTTEGLVSVKDRKLTEYPALRSVAGTALLEDHAGTVWVSGNSIPNGRLCAIRGSNVQCFGQAGELGRWAASLFESGGSVWLASERGLWRWAPGEPTLVPVTRPIQSGLQSLAEDNAGALLFQADGGV